MKPLWFDKVPLPREFILEEGASSYQEVLKIEEGTENLRSHDLLLALSRVGIERRRQKIMKIHRVVDENHIEVRYVPKRRTRMLAGSPLILIGSAYSEGQAI